MTLIITDEGWKIISIGLMCLVVTLKLKLSYGLQYPLFIDKIIRQLGQLRPIYKLMYVIGEKYFCFPVGQCFPLEGQP